MLLTILIICSLTLLAILWSLLPMCEADAPEHAIGFHYTPPQEEIHEDEC